MKTFTDNQIDNIVSKSIVILYFVLFVLGFYVHIIEPQKSRCFNHKQGRIYNNRHRGNNSGEVESLRTGTNIIG